MSATSRLPLYAVLGATLAGLALAGCGTAAAVQNSPARPLPNLDMPQPKPWTPPKTSLPQDVVDEASFLLAHGLGDPRGGEYRKAKVVLGTLWIGEATPQEVRGWVLPDGKRIVLPNGLVYDAVSVAEKADLKADVRAEIDRGRGTKQPGVRFVNPRGPLWGPIGTRLLLISGHADLAEALHAIRPSSLNHYGGTTLEEFLSSAFDQAVTAHMRGDDTTALRVGRLLERARPDFEARLLATVDPKSHATPDGRIIEGAAFPFLDPVPGLVADAGRRLQAPPRGPFDPAKATVAELVDRLDEVKARQWGQPGGVNLVDDPIVAALVEKGAPSVDSLFKAMESDDRLTRSVSFGRDFFPARNLITVKAAAYAAFRAIAQSDELPTGAEGRFDVAALRAYWKENGALSPAERWMNALADDKAGYRRWSEAAERLFETTDVQRKGAWTVIPSHRDPLAPRKADALRSRKNPSLGDLLAKRAIELSGPDSPHGTGGWERAVGLRLAQLLADWGGAAALPVLRTTSKAAMDRGAEYSANDLNQTGEKLATVLEARAKLGDATVWPEYADWLGRLPQLSGGSGDSAAKAFKPLIDHRDLPILREAARRLFLAPDGPNNLHKIAVDNPGYGWAESLAFTPLLELPEFREAVGQTLDDRTVIGEAWVDENGTVLVRHKNSTGGTGGDKKVLTDPLRPMAGEKRPDRICDRMAERLSALKEAPKFRPYWPTAEKDAAIVKLRAFLEANEGRMAEAIGWPYNWRQPGMGHP